MNIGYFISKNRLTFKRSVMDSIDEDGFYVNEIESLGIFKIPKKDFYKYFSNVVCSESWIQGTYSYKKIPSWANHYLTLRNKNNSSFEIEKNDSQNSQEKKDVDYVGDEIRAKIREIGKLWYTSPNRKRFSEPSSTYWQKLIHEWANDETLPLVVRKETNRRGESIKHPSGREIIFSDNSFATWVVCNVLNNILYSLDEIKIMLQKDEIPFMYISTKELKEKAKYKKALGDNDTIGWRLCHKKPIGFNKKDKIESMDIELIKQHFYNYANPGNIFLLPIEIGFLGELQDFINEQKE